MVPVEKSTAKAMTPGIRNKSSPTASRATTPASSRPAGWPLRSGYRIVPQAAVCTARNTHRYLGATCFQIFRGIWLSTLFPRNRIFRSQSKESQESRGRVHNQIPVLTQDEFLGRGHYPEGVAFQSPGSPLRRTLGYGCRKCKFYPERVA